MFHTVHIRYNDDTLDVRLNHESNLVGEGGVLEEIYAQWNAGSGRESRTFLSRQCRSLSVGDFVEVNAQWYVCASFGWNKVTDEQVAEWFTELANVRKLRRAGGTFEEERGLRWGDKRVVESRINLGANAFA